MVKRNGIKRNREIFHWYGGVRKREINFEAVKLEVSIRKPSKGAQHEMERPSPHRVWISATPPSTLPPDHRLAWLLLIIQA